MDKKAIGYVALVWLGFLAVVCCLVLWPKITTLILLGSSAVLAICTFSCFLYSVFKDSEA